MRHFTKDYYANLSETFENASENSADLSEINIIPTFRLEMLCDFFFLENTDILTYDTSSILSIMGIAMQFLKPSRLPYLT